MAKSYPLTLPVVALTDAATIATDASAGTTFTVTLAASRNMGAPTNQTDGQRIMYKITQGGAGSFVITWDAGAGGFQFTTGTPAPTLSTAAGKYDYVGFMYDSGSNKWNCLGYTIGLA